MSKDNKDQRPLSRKKRGYLLAVIGGTLGGPIGWITSPLVLYLLNRRLKEKDGKQPNIFKTWALIGIIGAPLSILPFSFFPEEGKEVEPKVEIDPAELKAGKEALEKIGVDFTEIETDNFGYKPSQKSCKKINIAIEKESKILNLKPVYNAFMACTARPKGILKTQDLIYKKGPKLKIQCIDLLKRELNDPNSLQVLNHRYTRKTMDNNELGITLDYTAKNAFGGRVRNIYRCTL